MWQSECRLAEEMNVRNENGHVRLSLTIVCMLVMASVAAAAAFGMAH